MPETHRQKTPSVCKRSLAERAHRAISRASCPAHDFKVLKLVGNKMIHVWIGPGYTDVPTFGHDNRYLYNGYYPKRIA